MPITEAVLKEKEAQLKTIQTQIGLLLNDDIPDEEQAVDIKELQSKLDTGFQTLEQMRVQLLAHQENASLTESPKIELDPKTLKKIKKIKDQLISKKTAIYSLFTEMETILNK